MALRRTPWSPENLWTDTKTLVSYGIRRVPGELCMASLLAAPTTITAHLSGVRAAGNVAFATSVLTMLATAFGPLGLILLPKMSYLVSTGDISGVRKRGNQLLAAAIALPVLVVATFEALAGRILSLYLPNADSSLVHVCRIVILAGLFYPVYISLRSVLDALSARAINSTNAFLSLLFFAAASAILYLAKPSQDLVLFAFVASIALLSALTVFTYRRAVLAIGREHRSAGP